MERRQGGGRKPAPTKPILLSFTELVYGHGYSVFVIGVEPQIDLIVNKPMLKTFMEKIAAAGTGVNAPPPTVIRRETRQFVAQVSIKKLLLVGVLHIIID